MAQSLQKNIRVNAEQLNRIEEADLERDVSPNQLVIELAINVLDRSEWPGPRPKSRSPGPRCSAAQILARDLIANCRQQEAQEIREVTSTIVPDLGNERGSNPHE